MSLTATNLQEIRNIFKEELEPVKGQLQALTNDIKEIYTMIAELQKRSGLDNDFSKLSIENKILKLHSQLKQAANQAGVVLPS